jgi:hypothetical protein
VRIMLNILEWTQTLCCLAAVHVGRRAFESDVTVVFKAAEHVVVGNPKPLRRCGTPRSGFPAAAGNYVSESSSIKEARRCQEGSCRREQGSCSSKFPPTSACNLPSKNRTKAQRRD